jgi:hypothetical protein
LKIIEERYLESIDALLKNGSVHKVRLLADKKVVVCITSKHLRRWWKRHKAFADC